MVRLTSSRYWQRPWGQCPAGLPVPKSKIRWRWTFPFHAYYLGRFLWCRCCAWSARCALPTDEEVFNLLGGGIDKCGVHDDVKIEKEDGGDGGGAGSALFKHSERHHHPNHGGSITYPTNLQGQNSSHPIYCKSTDGVADNGEVGPNSRKDQLHGNAIP